MNDEIEIQLAFASALLDEGRLEEAESAYRSCDDKLGAERSPRHAEVLVCLATIAKKRRQHRDAAALLDQALAFFPAHRGALSQRLAVAEELEDAATAAAIRLRMFTFAESDEARLHLLSSVVDDALSAAVGALRSALQLRPRDRALLERMASLHEATGAWTDAVNVRVTLAEGEPLPETRARAFSTAADLCATKTENVDRAVALYEAAIADDPAVPGAFAAIEKVLLDSGDVVGAEKAYVRQIERLAEHGNVAGRIALLHRLASHRDDRLADWQGAAAALDQLIALAPDDLDARVQLAGLLEAHEQDALAVRCLEVAAEKAPEHVATHHALHRLFVRANDRDRSYLVASVLALLGEAGEVEQATYRKHAPLVALSPSRALDDAAFALLAPGTADLALGAVASSIARAAVGVRLDQLRSHKMLPRVDPKERQDPEKTTVSAVRTAAWVARFFGLETPEIHARPGDPLDATLLATPEPAIALGDGLLSGRTVPELAFRLGYELAYLRLVDRLVAVYPSLADLRTVIAAAVAAAMPSEPPPELAALSVAIAQRLDPVQRLRLTTAVQQIGARGGQLDVVTWLRDLERTACRAGLLACGDLTVAAHMVSVDGRIVAGLTARDRVRDLVSFSVTEPYARLRAAVGVAV